MNRQTDRPTAIVTLISVISVLSRTFSVIPVVDRSSVIHVSSYILCVISAVTSFNFGRSISCVDSNFEISVLAVSLKWHGVPMAESVEMQLSSRGVDVHVLLAGNEKSTFTLYINDDKIFRKHNNKWIFFHKYRTQLPRI
jgi:hypothetical protein